MRVGGLLLGLVGCVSPEGPEPVAWVDLPPGTVVLGRDDAAYLDERPAHPVRLSAFQLQATLVTVADLRRYVEQTGAVTDAERLGFGMTAFLGMEDWAWARVAGATWRSPWGPAADNPQQDDHPATMLSWSDADAYCRHHGWRLPTEAEWVYAMSAGDPSRRYPWGDAPARAPGQPPSLNYWQGRDHTSNALEDGFLYTSPVRAFPPNDWGLFDPVGNVWQWTADWYGAETYAQHGGDAVDPTGPPEGWARVARGGSWWCSQGTCSGYGLHARGKTRPHAPYANNGFRCARDPA